jgi:small-conductance mechanosensitive channel/CRP-like cAMP-binding protein
MLDPLDPTRVIAAALALGVAASALSWPLRKSRQGRRALFAIWLAVLGACIAVTIERGALSNMADDGALPLTFKIARATWLFLAVNGLLQLFDLALWEGILARLRQTRVPRLLINVLNVVVLTLTGLLIASQVFDLPLSTLVVSSTVASAVLGLALQDVLRSMVAGIVLQIESPFSLGDWVELGGYEGVIAEMNWRTVTLRTRQNHHVVLTNGGVSSGHILNYSRPSRLQGIDAFIGVAYPHPPEQVKSVLAAALVDTPGVRKTPAPRVFTTGYQDFSIQYRIRYWITEYAELREIQDAVMTRLWYALQRAGMTIPFPIRDVNLRTIPEDAAARQAEARWERIAAILAPLPLLDPLDEAQIGQLAAGATVKRFAIGETLMHEGEEGGTLFVLGEGEAEVRVKGADGSPVAVAHRQAGDIMGEMSLLTGAPRSASVVATAEVEAIVVDKATFGEVLLGDPKIAERLSEILAARELEQLTRVAEAGARMPTPANMRDEILGRIRHFFALS